MPPEGASSWAAAGQAGQHFFCCWAGDTDPGRPPGAAPVADHCPAGWHLRGPGEERYNRVSGLSLRRGQESPAVTTALHSELRPLNGNGGCAGPTAIPARCPQGWPLTGTGARAGISTSDSSGRRGPQVGPLSALATQAALPAPGSQGAQNPGLALASCSGPPGCSPCSPPLALLLPVRLGFLCWRGPPRRSRAVC